MDRELDYLLGGATKWKGKYKIDWCELCESIILSHEECPNHATTCNCAGCPDCHDDFSEFTSLNMQPYHFLNEVERAAYVKHQMLKRYLFECLDAGKTILDWQWLLWEGKLCRAAEEIFTKELKGLDKNPKWDKLREIKEE